MLNNKFEINVIAPNSNKIINYIKLKFKNINGIYYSKENFEMRLYKSYNNTIFNKNIESFLLALDGNSPVLNLIQDAKNSSKRTRIYINKDFEQLNSKLKLFDSNIRGFSIEKNMYFNILRDIY